MKKPSKKQDVFRASQKSFFLRSWGAPGQCPMVVLIFFHVFLDFWPKMVAKRVPKKYTFFAFCPPERTKIASATRPRLFIDFPSILDPIFIDFWYFWDPFWVAFMLVRRFRRFPNTYPLILIRRFPPRGAAVSPCDYNDFWPPFWGHFPRNCTTVFISIFHWLCAQGADRRTPGGKPANQY